MNTEISTLLKTKPARQWIRAAAAKPVPQPLCGDLWHEGELAIMFADTGLGKSVLAVRIADAIAAGDDGEPDKLDIFMVKGGPRTVLYLDFELTDKQFEMRYASGPDESGTVEHHEFSERLYRSVLDLTAEVPKGMTFNEFLLREIERELDETQASVLIVDNITYLRGSHEGSREASELMRELRSLMERRNISILALAHSPKRIARRPLTINDLQGSKSLSNFADSIFAIGESCLGPDIRYIKQIKSRSRQIGFDAGRVAGCMLINEGPMLTLEHVGCGPELNHLLDFDAAYRIRLERRREIDCLVTGGLSQREIAEKLDISPATVNRYINQYATYPADDGRHELALYNSYGYGFRRQIHEDLDREEAEAGESGEAVGSSVSVESGELTAPVTSQPTFDADSYLKDIGLRE